MPTGGSDPKVSDKCVGGRVKPLSPATVAAVFKQHGFSVRISTTSTNCQGFDAAFLNTPEAPAYSISNNPEWENSEISDREGTLSCLLHKGPVWGSKLKRDLHAAPNSPIFSGRKAEFRYENLDCTLYPPEGREDAQVQRLDRAIAVIVSRR
ncbi:MAG: hypothetical protein ACXWZ8_10505 [Gaiellaceae bacterium]